MKTSELIGHALNWAVGKANGVFDIGVYAHVKVIGGKLHLTDDAGGVFNVPYEPSTTWAQGGLIIEREKIETVITVCPEQKGSWFCCITSTPFGEYGPTPLIAAMRCFVASKLGDEVEVPLELL